MIGRPINAGAGSATDGSSNTSGVAVRARMSAAPRATDPEKRPGRDLAAPTFPNRRACGHETSSWVLAGPVGSSSVWAGASSSSLWWWSS